MPKALAVAFVLSLTPLLGHSNSEVVGIGAFEFSEGLATVVLEGKWGYIDSRGELVIPAIYDIATGMNNGVAVVAMEGKQLLIDHSGDRIQSESIKFVPRGYEESTLMHFFEAQPDDTAKWGFKNLQGSVVIPPVYDAAYKFSEGLAMFGIRDESIPETRMRYGYIDYSGNEVIPASFQLTTEFSQGVAQVIDNYRHFFINKNGEKMFNQDFAFAFNFSEGLAAVDIMATSRAYTFAVQSPEPSASWGYLDLSGKLAIPARYDEARPFREGVAPVRIGKYWGLINTAGEEVVPATHSQIGESSEGLIAFLSQEGKWGFLDQQGHTVITPSYDVVFPFKQGFAAVRTEAGHGYIDHKGTYIWEPTK